MDSIKSKKLYVVVEGAMFVYGETALEGSVLVSFQHLSSYNASRHAPPHEYIIAFSTQAGGLTG